MGNVSSRARAATLLALVLFAGGGGVACAPTAEPEPDIEILDTVAEETAPPEETVDAGETSTATTSGPTVVMMTCDLQNPSLFSVVIETGEVTQSPTPTTCNIKNPVSPDGKKFLFVSVDSADNSSHVGWYDGTTRVDMTALLKQESGALAPVRQDKHPVFTWDNNFAFVDTLSNTVVTVDTTSMEVIREQEHPTYGEEFTINPDGTANRADDGVSSFPLAFEIPGAPGSKFCPRWQDYVSFFPGDGTAMLRSFIVVKDSGVSGGSGCNDAETVRTLLPETDYTIRGSAYDPASGLVYFSGQRGAEAYLFAVALDGTGGVEQVADLSDLIQSEAAPTVVGFHP